MTALCGHFDEGQMWAASDLATVVFTLVHDGGSITSLLTQLGFLPALQFVSSGRATPPEPNVFSHQSPPLLLTVLSFNEGPQFKPRLDVGDAHEIVSFETWWVKELIGPPPLTRQRLVNSLRHQDGGAHVGRLTDQAYVALKDGAGWLGSRNGDVRPMEAAAAASMRQVAWELTESLAKLGEIK